MASCELFSERFNMRMLRSFTRRQVLGGAPLLLTRFPAIGATSVSLRRGPPSQIASFLRV